MARKRPVFVLLLTLLIVATAIIAAWFVYEYYSTLLHVGDHRLDPNVQFDSEQRYSIVVWEQDAYMPNVSREARRAALQAAAAEFSYLYPNITIHIEFLPEEHFTQTLQQSLLAGVGPDIAHVGYDGILIDADVQIPVTPYMPEETKHDLLPAAASYVADDEHIWVWPRTLKPLLWLTRNTDHPAFQNMPLLRGHTLIHSAHAEQEQKQTQPKLAVNANDPLFAASIVVASSGRALFDRHGNLQWTQDDLERLAQMLLTFIEHDVFVDMSWERMAQTRFRRLWDGTADIVGPVTLLATHNVLVRAGELTYDAQRTSTQQGETTFSLSSPPLFSDALHGIPGFITGYAVFHSPQHPESDHVSAVMQVAHHLSKRIGYWDAVASMAVPVYGTLTSTWQAESGLHHVHAHHVLNLAERIVGLPLSHKAASRQQHVLHEVITPAVTAFLASPVAPAEFSEKTWQQLRAYLNTYRDAAED